MLISMTLAVVCVSYPAARSGNLHAINGLSMSSATTGVYAQSQSAELAESCELD
jgi:hypothetical protein